MSDETVCAPYISMGLLVELLPQYNPVSVYRWRNTKGSSRLPEPDLVVGPVALWMVATIQDWAAGAGKVLDEGVLARIIEGQTV